MRLRTTRGFRSFSSSWRGDSDMAVVSVVAFQGREADLTERGKGHSLRLTVE